MIGLVGCFTKNSYCIWVPTRWIRLVQQCLSTISYWILITGATSNLLMPQCRLRQVDPLSPYMFLFCMDIFSRMTSFVMDIRNFQGDSGVQARPFHFASIFCR